jgi:ribosomal protein L31E
MSDTEKTPWDRQREWEAEKKASLGIARPLEETAFLLHECEKINEAQAAEIARLTANVATLHEVADEREAIITLRDAELTNWKGRAKRQYDFSIEMIAKLAERDNAVMLALAPELADEIACLTAENESLQKAVEAQKRQADFNAKVYCERDDLLEMAQELKAENEALRALVAEAREAAARLVEDAPDHGISKQSLWRLAAAIRALAKQEEPK